VSVERAAEWVADIEAVECVQNLVRGAAAEVQRSGGVPHDARHRLKGAAQVARGGIRNIENLQAAERLLAARAVRIDRGRRGAHLHLLENLPLVVQYQVNLALAHLGGQRKESFGFDRDGIFLLGRQSDRECATRQPPYSQKTHAAFR
jgi:hypothetical protein